MANPRFTPQQVTNFGRRITGTTCCGLAEYNGMEYITSASDAAAVRRAAHSVRHAGQVFVTITGIQMQQHPERLGYLKAGGFRKHATFRNPNTQQQVTLLSATTIKRNQPPVAAEAGEPPMPSCGTRTCTWDAHQVR